MRIMQAVLIVTCCALGNAPQQIPATPPEAAAAENFQIAPQLRTVVDALEGTWSIIWINKDGQTTGKGEELWKFAPGRSAFIEENRSKVNGKAAEDYAVLWWDAKAQKIHGIWCDATINDEGCSGFAVAPEGRDIVLTGEWEYKGKRQAWREVFSRKGAAMTQTLYIGEPEKELKLASTIRGSKR